MIKYKYIINPKTKRKVLVIGKVGIQILTNFLKLLKGGAMRSTREKRRSEPYSKSKQQELDNARLLLGLSERRSPPLEFEKRLIKNIESSNPTPN